MLAALLLGSCRGDEGPMGPMGPAGPAGLDGKDGQDGRDGKDGEGFKTLEFTFTVEQNDWEIVKDTPEPYFRCVFDFKELESSIIDHGMLTVYRMLDDDYYATLPITKPHKETNDNGDIYYTQLKTTSLRRAQSVSTSPTATSSSTKSPMQWTSRWWCITIKPFFPPHNTQAAQNE